MAPLSTIERPVETQQAAIQKVFDLIAREEARMVDIRFVDFLGQHQHFFGASRSVQTRTF